MYKNATYKQKYAILKNWMPSIIESVKKDVKNEHLKNDPLFVKKYLPSKNYQKVSVEELVDAYSRAIQEEGEKGEQIGEFITSRWLLQNSEVYDLFENELKKINPDFSSLDSIDLTRGKELIQSSSKAFGPTATYIFAVLNSVVFPDELFHELEKQSVKHEKEQKIQNEENKKRIQSENERESFEREIARLTDKYEKKLSGLQKKYQIDTEALKKQIATLQRKIAS